MGTRRRSDILYSVNYQICSSERCQVPFGRTTLVVDWIEYASVYPFQLKAQKSWNWPWVFSQSGLRLSISKFHILFSGCRRASTQDNKEEKELQNDQNHCVDEVDRAMPKMSYLKGDTSEPLKYLTIGQLLEHTVSRFAHKVAISFHKGEKLTYEQVLERVSRTYLAVCNTVSELSRRCPYFHNLNFHQISLTFFLTNL